MASQLHLYIPPSGMTSESNDTPRYHFRPFGRRRSARKTDSLPVLRLVPPNRPLFTCPRCQSSNTLIPICVFCGFSQDAAAKEYEEQLQKVCRSTISAPQLRCWAPTPSDSLSSTDTLSCGSPAESKRSMESAYPASSTAAGVPTSSTDDVLYSLIAPPNSSCPSSPQRPESLSRPIYSALRPGRTVCMSSPASPPQSPRALVPKIDPHSSIANSPYSANYVYSSAVHHALGLAPPALLAGGDPTEDVLDKQLEALVEAEAEGWDPDGEPQRHDLRRRSRRLRSRSRGTREWREFVHWVRGFV